MAAAPRRLAAALGLAAWSALAAAQSVSLAGSLGAGKALLLIDGAPQVLAVGAAARGVTLRRVGDGQAEVELADGQRLLLRLGAAPQALGGAPAASGGSSIVLPLGPGGHAMAEGTINGRSVQFMVDTGATTVALSQREATRIGLDWQRGQRAVTQTANGPVPIHALTLSAVRIGGVEVANVAAVVLPADMPMVLLGNSFLSRFTLRQDGDTLRLEKKP